MPVRIVEDTFEPAAELAAFTASHRHAGGVVSFIGQVRAGDEVEALELKHYGPLTLRGMEALAAQTRDRWPLEGLLIIHRVGAMLPGEAIVLVAAASRHRRDAFAAADFVMDHLKSESWYWKREKRGGAWAWVEPRTEDFADLARWKTDLTEPYDQAHDRLGD